MKNRGNLFVLLTSSLLFLFAFVNGQVPNEEITFIKITDKLGYVIDSIENDQYKCIPYVGKKEYCYSALIQLPDSSVILRIKLTNQNGFRNVYMAKTDVDNLHTNILSNISKKSVSKNTEEEKLMTEMAGESSFKLGRYDSLVYRSLNLLDSDSVTKNQKPINKQNSFVFFQGGIGIGNFNNQGVFSYGIEFGVINKKSVFSIRYIKLKESQNSGSLILNEKMSPLEHISDFGILYGRVLDLEDDVCVTFSMGLAYTSGIARGAFNHTVGGGTLFSTYTSFYDEIAIQTIGIPFEATLFLGARRGINCDINFYGNINKSYSFFGALVCLRIGAVKNASRNK